MAANFYHDILVVRAGQLHGEMVATASGTDVVQSSGVASVMALGGEGGLPEHYCTEVRMNQPHDIGELLEQMGATPDEVAATLRAAGVQGVRNTVRILNPVVRYVQIVLRRDNLDADVMTGKSFRIHSAGGQEAALPRAILDFLDSFNNGAYPDLELPAN